MIHFTSSAFDAYTKNPYCQDLPYDNTWILVQLVDGAAFDSFTGNEGNGIFRLILNKQKANWQFSVMDFIGYQSALQKNIIVAAEENDLAIAYRVYAGHSYTDRFLRPYESSVLVHTTTPDAYQSILKCGCLKSWNRLHPAASADERPIGALLGDPEDFSDYIMFAEGGYYIELIPLSKEQNALNMSVHALYTPGARLYLDAKKMAQDGLLVRDGTHLKVKHALPLKNYLLWTATTEKLGLPRRTTPFEFGSKADAAFWAFANRTRS